MDAAKIKAQSAQTWSQGEYSVLSEQLRPAARVLADLCAVSAGQEVLDNAAGDGNFAVISAEEGASVVAADIAPGMLVRGRERAEAEGVEIEWVEADAEDLPFEDARFDCVGSVFGAMIAPRPRIAAEQMFRVVKPGGTVGMTAWMDSGANYDVFSVGRRYAPPPEPGEEAPGIEEWSHEENVRERFEGLASSIEITEHTLPWEGDSPEEFVAQMERGAPPQAMAKANMPPDLYAQMREELVEVARGWAGGDGPFSVDGRYVAIVVAPARLTLAARLLIEYDGTDFAGWATQPGRRTVQETLEAAIATITREPVALMVAGRTDAGVHARGQVASHPGTPIPAQRLNGLLPPDLAVVSSDPAPDAFDARRDARERTYRYRVLTRPARSPHERRTALHWRRPCDLQALHACAAALTGSHDFTAFTPTGGYHSRFTRDVTRSEWVEYGDVLEYWITADSFMRHMVRTLVGAMLWVSAGRMEQAAFERLLEGRPRSEAPDTAPAHGLCLEAVGYD